MQCVYMIYGGPGDLLWQTMCMSVYLLVGTMVVCLYLCLSVL